MTRVAVQPELFRWARERAKLDAHALAARFPKLPAWEAGEQQPTLRQLEGYARATHAPVGFFFLPAPPVEPLPIPDFRTVADRPIARVGADLLDVIYACQVRQSWYRDEALVTGQLPLAFVGSVAITTHPVEAAAQIRLELNFSVESRRDCPTWAEALRMFVAQADGAGVLVMVSGVVANNNTRALDPSEFRGFAIVDPLAPLVFINGADNKSAQMFTLAHELAHLWLGQSALSNAGAESPGTQAAEIWCNQVAAELLVPTEMIRDSLVEGEELADALRRLTRHFKVSSLVILRRLLDTGQLARDQFWAAFRAEQDRFAQSDARSGGGGDFYRTTTSRVGKRFARRLVESTLEGRTLYRDAFQMLGIAKTSTFNELGRTLGMPV